MSTKTLRKRIALVAVASLGFGLMSTVPANAAAAAVTDVSVTITSGQTADPSLSITAGSGATLITKSYSVYTRNATVAIGAISAAMTSAGDTTAGYLQLKVAAGTTLSIGSTAATAFLYRTAIMTTATPMALVVTDGTSAFATFTASAAGTTYLIWNDGVAAAAGGASTGVQDSKYTDTEAYAQVTFYQTSAAAVTATLDTPTTTIAGRTGQQVSITPRGDLTTLTVGSASHPVLRIAAAITTQPATSLVYANLAAIVPADLDLRFADTGTTVSTTAAVVTTGSTASASAVATINYSGFGNTVVSGSDANLGTVTFTPTVAGTYVVNVWNESDTSSAASLSGAESYQVFTINVSAGVSTVTLTAQNSTAASYVAATSGINGSLIKVALKDAAGNAAILAPGETITLTPSGSGKIAYVNGGAVTSAAGAAYNLSSASFNASGTAWINMTDAVAETSTLTASLVGGASASISPKFVSTVVVAAVPGTVTAATGFKFATPNYTVPVGTSSMTYKATASAGSSVGFTVTETVTSGAGAITGYSTALSYDAAVTVGTGVTTGATHTVSATAATTGITLYEVSTDATTAAASSGTEAVTATLTNTSGALTVNVSTVNAIVGSTNKLTITLKDLFARAYANQTVTAAVTGKNPTTLALSAVTDALGQATFTFTDANTNTAVNDVVTFTAGSTAATTISYGANAPATVTLTSTGDTDVIAGTTATDISAAAAGATGTSATASAVVKNAGGAVLAGVPVTFVVTGLVGAEVHTTTATVYTDTTGTAVGKVSSYAAGKATVTATAGTITATDDIYFEQATPDEARTIAISAVGGLVTATVKDRYGNVIKGVTVDASRTGTGYFGAGASTAQGLTDKDGKVEFNFVGSGTVKVAFTSATYGQTYAAAGYDADAVNGTAITAVTAGTTTANQKGLGAALAPIGINSASLAVEGANLAADNSQAAADAAAEATDAANAATDAANAAAEAADAATAAAQDAADAVAALSTQVSEMVNALKKQITALTNLVIKIQKKVKA
jgi:hypothetical protein